MQKVTPGILNLIHPVHAKDDILQFPDGFQDSYTDRPGASAAGDRIAADFEYVATNTRDYAGVINSALKSLDELTRTMNDAQQNLSDTEAEYLDRLQHLTGTLLLYIYEGALYRDVEYEIPYDNTMRDLVELFKTTRILIANGAEISEVVNIDSINNHLNTEAGWTIVIS